MDLRFSYGLEVVIWTGGFHMEWRFLYGLEVVIWTGGLIKYGQIDGERDR